MESVGKSRQVIHLHLRESDEHHYFGSISAMYDNYSSKQIGVASQTLYNSWKDEPYITDIAVIRKGRLVQKRKKQ